MSLVAVYLEDYSGDTRVEVDAYDGLVHLDLRHVESPPDTSLRPDEARALAAVLNHAADEGERRPGS